MNDFLYKVQTRFLFHADVRIKIPAACTDDHFDALFDILERIDKRYNSYQKGSYFDLINQHAGNFVTVDDEVIRMLKQVKEFSAFFDGRYAITVMPLIRLWGFYKGNVRRVPTPDEIAHVLPLVDDDKIDILGNDVRIAKGQEIVTGSFIKSYAVDQLMKKMREMRISDAIVNAGGSTIMALNNTSHPFWQTSVDIPGKNDPLFLLNIANQAYSTSAQGDSFVEIDGKRYGHILNPKTGYPSINRMVGVVTDSAMLGDMLSTGLFNETRTEFLQKMQQLQQHYPNLAIEGFLMDEAGQLIQTAGFEAHKEPA
ncbi:MAG: FAD:protein FMN transferase [Oxalobacter sp.]|nr:MAG: FAD:protein FMN transferase [Oxalobacter sp.]